MSNDTNRDTNRDTNQRDRVSNIGSGQGNQGTDTQNARNGQSKQAENAQRQTGDLSKTDIRGGTPSDEKSTFGKDADKQGGMNTPGRNER